MAFSLSDICSKNLTKSHRHPYGIRSDGERNPIGRRTESDRAANANGGTLRGCTCLKCTNRARKPVLDHIISFTGQQ